MDDSGHNNHIDLHAACCGHDGVDQDKRQTLDLLASGGLAAMLAGLAGSLPSMAQAQNDDVVRIGYLPITDATPLLVAHAKGFFADEGLEAEQPTLIRGWAPLIEGFTSNKFNLVHFLKPIPVWMRYNNNFPVKIMAWAHTNGSALVVGGHTEISDFAGLGGKQVAVPFWYSMHNIVLQYALRAAGIKAVIKSQDEPLAPDECNLQVLPPPDMPPALAARKIDAYIVAEPFNALGELRAGARMLRFTGDIWKNHPCCVVCMMRTSSGKGVQGGEPWAAYLLAGGEGDGELRARGGRWRRPRRAWAPSRRTRRSPCRAGDRCTGTRKRSRRIR